MMKPQRHMRRILSLIALVGLIGVGYALGIRPEKIVLAQAATAYYVDNLHPQADDSGPGTQSQPWEHAPGMPGWTGTATLEPGDAVYFNSAGTWTASSGDAVIQVVGGVTYDGCSWGSGERATLRATGYLNHSVINFMEDHPSEPTVVRGFEVDAGGQETSGIGINWPHASQSLTGATKRIEDCVVHDVYSQSAQGQYEYGVVVSSGYGGNRQVSNVEVLDCVTFDISRGGINIYSANDDPNSGISNVLVRGNEIYASGQDPSYAGSSLAAKNHIVNVIFEYNTVRDPERGPGIGISTHQAGFTGPENLIIRHNIIANSPHTGIYIQGAGNKSLEIYGNLIINNAYEGMTFASSLADSLSARIYNNTFFQNYEPEWGSEIRVHDTNANITTFELSNNIFVSDADTRCLIDDEGSITNHSNNIYFRPSSDVLVIANGASYDADDINSWESTALTTDPLFVDSTQLPTGFTGVFGVDLQPNTDGLNLTTSSPARDAGIALGGTYNTSINSVLRPSGVQWDIGAYEFAPTLALRGVPGDEIIHLNWSITSDLPPTTTWTVTYEGPTGDQPSPIEDIPEPTRAFSLTGLTNYAWYTVTLKAVVDSESILSDTVRLMPTNHLVSLPLVLRDQ